MASALARRPRAAAAVPAVSTFSSPKMRGALDETRRGSSESRAGRGRRRSIRRDSRRLSANLRSASALCCPAIAYRFLEAQQFQPGGSSLALRRWLRSHAAIVTSLVSFEPPRPWWTLPLPGSCLAQSQGCPRIKTRRCRRFGPSRRRAWGRVGLELAVTQTAPHTQRTVRFRALDS